MGEDRHLSTEAIILKTSISSEINKNFTFISPIIGIQHATAFGAAKTKSRFCSSVQQFTAGKVFLYKSPKSTYYKLEDITDVNLNEFIKNNLKKYYISSFFSELLLESYISNDDFKSYYYLLLYSFELLEKNDANTSFLFFLSKFLVLLGYNYHLKNCKKCQNQSKQYYFDSKEGGIFCENHAKSKKYIIKSVTAELWNNFLNKKYVELKSIKVTEKDVKDLFNITIHIVDSIFEKRLKTINSIIEVFD